MYYTCNYNPKRFSFGESYYQKVKFTCVFTKDDKSPRRVLKKLLREQKWLGPGYYFISAVYYCRRDTYPTGIFGWMEFEEVANTVFDQLFEKNLDESLLTMSFSFTDHPISQQLLGVEKRKYGIEHQKSQRSARNKKMFMIRILDGYKSMGFKSFIL